MPQRRSARSHAGSSQRPLSTAQRAGIEKRKATMAAKKAAQAMEARRQATGIAAQDDHHPAPGAAEHSVAPIQVVAHQPQQVEEQEIVAQGDAEHEVEAVQASDSHVQPQQPPLPIQGDQFDEDVSS